MERRELSTDLPAHLVERYGITLHDCGDGIVFVDQSKMGTPPEGWSWALRGVLAQDVSVIISRVTTNTVPGTHIQLHPIGVGFDRFNDVIDDLLARSWQVSASSDYAEIYYKTPKDIAMAFGVPESALPAGADTYGGFDK